MLSGGAVPGGRGVGIIDVDFEEARDEAYVRELEAGDGGADELGDGDGAALSGVPKETYRSDEEPTSAKRAPPRPRSRSANPTPSTRSKVGTALGAYVDEVIEIPDDHEGDLDGGLAKRGRRPKSGSPKSLLVARSKSTASAEKSRGVSKPTSSRMPPPGTSTSARDIREVEEAITLDPGAESEFVPAVESDFVMGDGGLEDDQPLTTVKSTKSKSKAAPKPDAKGKGRPKKSAPADGETSAEEDVEAQAVKGRLAKAGAKFKPAPSKKAPPQQLGSSPQPVKYPSPYRPKPHLVRRSLASSAVQRSEAESEPEPQMEDVEAAPTRSDKRATSTSKSKAASKVPPKGKTRAADSDSESELSAPARRPGAIPKSTPVKSGMKPRPQPKQTVDDQNESEDEVYVRPVRGKGSEKRKEKSESKDKGSSSSKPKTKNASKEKLTPGSPTRLPSPAPPTKDVRTPKRTLSVVVPSVPKDYFSPSKDAGGSAKSTNEKPKEIVRTTSIRATAAEASTSATKRAKAITC
ncbi:hypothetical protein BU15DRAFT_76143 [Melanogaster broomeanus]|nr:hypothetical protein BU15DRAFT_76143 [Melanogaster broomeanus]